MTERAKIYFEEKLYADGVTAFVAITPFESDLEILDRWSVSFDLRGGASYAKAAEVCKFLNENVECLTVTPLPGPRSVKTS